MIIYYFRASALFGLLLSMHFPGASAADLSAQSVPAVFTDRFQHPLDSSLGMLKECSSQSAFHTQAIRGADDEADAVRRPAAVYL